MSVSVVGACIHKARRTACQTEPEECSNRCEGGCGAAMEFTVKENDVDAGVQQKEMEKKHRTSTVQKLLREKGREDNGHTLLIIIKELRSSKNFYFGLETFRKEKKAIIALFVTS